MLTFYTVSVSLCVFSLYGLVVSGGQLYTFQHCKQVSKAFLKYLGYLSYVTLAVCLGFAMWSSYMIWANRLKPRPQAVKRVARDVEDLHPGFLAEADHRIRANFLQEETAWETAMMQAEHDLL